MANNVLFILSDEHARDISGCYGNTIVQTPNIDALSARGVTFDSAYCNSPICVPSRASLATGEYVNRIRYWDNAHAYDGHVPSWHHSLRDAGHEVVSIGKLHYRSADDDSGFSQVNHPIYIPDGQGDVLGLLRRDPKPRAAARAMAENAGSGPSGYADFDNSVADASVSWLQCRTEQQDKPWALFVSFLKPHFPLISPPEFYDIYADMEMPTPHLYDPAERPSHPGIDAYRTFFNYDDYFDEETLQVALKAYYGMCSFLDFNIGRVLEALNESGQAENTLVIYSSDHGENLGSRGIWGKSVLYEEACAVPMIMAGPNVAEGDRCPVPVSLVDIYPTMIQTVGGSMTDQEQNLPGTDLRALAQGSQDDRIAFSEYHAAGSTSAGYMVRRGNWKYIYYVGHPPLLFDLAADPGETTDLADRPETAGIQAELDRELRNIVDPEAANAAAFADQEKRIEELGGEEVLRAKTEIGFTPAPTN